MPRSSAGIGSARIFAATSSKVVATRRNSDAISAESSFSMAVSISSSNGSIRRLASAQMRSPAAMNAALDAACVTAAGCVTVTAAPSPEPQPASTEKNQGCRRQLHPDDHSVHTTARRGLRQPAALSLRVDDRAGRRLEGVLVGAEQQVRLSERLCDLRELVTGRAVASVPGAGAVPVAIKPEVMAGLAGSRPSSRPPASARNRSQSADMAARESSSMSSTEYSESRLRSLASLMLEVHRAASM